MKTYSKDLNLIKMKYTVPEQKKTKNWNNPKPKQVKLCYKTECLLFQSNGGYSVNEKKSMPFFRRASRVIILLCVRTSLGMVVHIWIVVCLASRIDWWFCWRWWWWWWIPMTATTIGTAAPAGRFYAFTSTKYKIHYDWYNP